jgi:hypothetical protein
MNISETVRRFGNDGNPGRLVKQAIPGWLSAQTKLFLAIILNVSEE